jgi:hypothetical protein
MRVRALCVTHSEVCATKWRGLSAVGRNAVKRRWNPSPNRIGQTPAILGSVFWEKDDERNGDLEISVKRNTKENRAFLRGTGGTLFESGGQSVKIKIRML